jgi:hypothetical protein
MKRLVVLVVVLGALVAASTASASKVQLFGPCQWTAPALKTSGGSAGNQTVTNPVWISFGWAAQQRVQVQQFLDAQYSNGISITDASGSVVYSTSWTQGGAGNGSWSAIAPQTIQDRAGNQSSGFASLWRSPDLTLAAGQYTLALDVDLAKGVNDGFGAAKPGSWLNITACTFTVA